MPSKTISIIINNYNYGRYLSTAIESALAQTRKPFEIIVVDDGSTDNSLAILDKYEDRVIVLKKKNGGQASALNAGFEISKGEWIWFVDSDDWLMPDAIEMLEPSLEEGMAKVHFPLRLANEEGKDLGGLHPSHLLSDGFVLEEIQQTGDYKWPPTTGNIFSRNALLESMPIPEDYRLCADFYINSLAAIAGRIKACNTPLGFYRIHAANGFYGFSLDSKRVNKHGAVILKATDHTENLMRKVLGNDSYQYPYTRSVLESLTISRRFGGLQLPAKLRGSNIHRKWFHSAQVRNASAKAKLIAVAFWMVLNFAPKNFAGYLIRKGMKKADKQKDYIQALELQ